jgi:hypothetical protein
MTLSRERTKAGSNDHIYVGGDGSQDKVFCGDGHDYVAADPNDIVEESTCEEIVRG